MLSIEVKVNGRPVITVEAYREEMFTGEPGAVPSLKYPYRGSRFPLDKDGEVETMQGAVDDHAFDDGLLVLARKILEDAEK